MTSVATSADRLRAAGRRCGALSACSLLAAPCCCFLRFAAFAAELPALTGRVVDNAGMIDPATEAALVQKLAAFEKKSSDQIVVATIASLDGEAIEPYANRLFRAWGLGQAGEDNGILLLVAKNDRKMRIEVGYGLEGTLTDLHSKLIIENTMVPAFRAGDFSGGISRAVDDIDHGAGGQCRRARSARRAQPADAVCNLTDLVVVLFIIVWATLFFGGFAMAILPPIFGRKIGPGRYRWLGMDFNYNSSRSLVRRRLVVGRIVGRRLVVGRRQSAAADFRAAAARPAAAARRGAGRR